MEKSRWSAVAAFALVGAATQMVWLTFAPVTTVAAERYGVSETAIGWLANVFVLAFVVLAIPAGLLLDRHLRTMLVVGAVLTATGACLRLIGDDFSWLLVGGLVAALGQPVILTGITGLTRGYLRAEDRAVGIALATASTWAGFIAAFALSAVFSTADSLPNLIAVDAAYAVFAAILLTIALRTPPPFLDEHAATSSASWAIVKKSWADPLIRRVCIFAFLPFGTFVALSTWTQSLLKPAGVSVDQVGIILSATVIAGVIGTAILPVWAARTRREVLTGAIGVTVTAIVCFVLAVAPGFGTALAGLTLAGLALLPMLAIVLEIIERRSGDSEGVAAGLAWTMGNLGGLVVTGIVGFTLHSPGLSFVLLGAMTLLALPLLRGLRAPVAALSAGGEVSAADGSISR